MGVPLYYNFGLFRALDKRSEALHTQGGFIDGNFSWEREQFLKAVKQFNLFAFILHDPESHPEFHNYLRSVFEDLDSSTGEKLLFFALVDPSRDWLEEKRLRSFHSAVKRFEYFARLHHTESLPDSDPSSSAYSIAWALGIPPDDLPVILVTDDLKSNNYKFLRTSVSKVRDQLIALGRSALRFRSPVDNSRSVPRRLRNIEKSSVEYSGIEDLEVPPFKINLAETLSDIMSAVLFTEKKNYYIDNPARRQIESVLRNLQAKLHENRREFGDIGGYSEDFEYYAVYLANLISILARNRRIQPPALSIDHRFLEPESRRMLTTALNVMAYLNQPEIFSPGITSDELDYSPSAICFAKCFEREVNLSFIHWVRWYLGVRMPRYFDRFDPDSKALYIPDNMNFRIPRTVDFNAGNNQGWKAPTLGSSQVSLASLSSKEVFRKNFHYLAEMNTRIVLELWREFKDLRNNAAHPGMLRKHELDRMVFILSDMNEIDLFSAMNEMKKRFRGQ